MTHNDFIPSNVLALHGQVTAVLDFELATHGIRALDFSMAPLICLRYWMNPDPYQTAMLLSRGYGRANTLTRPEIEALPRLLRLRNMASTLWWLGRAMGPGDGRAELLRIERTREFARWLERWGILLMAAVASQLA